MVGRISSIRVRKLPIWLALTFFLSVFAGWASYPTGAQADTCHTSNYSVGDQATIMDLNGGCSYIGVRHKYDPVWSMNTYWTAWHGGSADQYWTPRMPVLFLADTNAW